MSISLTNTARRSYVSPVRDEQTERTRQRIVSAVVEAVATGGAANLTVSDVARRAAVSPATVYRYFPTKADLVASMTLHDVGQLGADLDPHSPKDFADDIADLFAVIHAHEDFFRASALTDA